MLAQGAEIVVFWGSQSGTCERLASRLCREIYQRFGKKALAADLSDYEPSSIARIPQNIVTVFIVSTYGEGEPSDNTMELWNWLESHSTTSLQRLRYAALGLGNSNYKYYNAVVDVVASKLNLLGAQAILPTGKADDAKGETEEHYLDWKTSFFGLLIDQLGYQEHDPVYEPSIRIVEDDSDQRDSISRSGPWTEQKDRKTMRTMSPNHELSVKAARELFDETSDRNCLHMEIDLNVNEYTGLKYRTGDHVGVWATNPKEEVQRLTRLLGLFEKLETPLRIELLDHESKLKVPTPTTISALFSHYLEVCAPVSRETISALVQFAPTADAKNTLIKLSSDRATHSQLLESNYINFGRLLELVANCEGAWKDLPLSFVIEMLPTMQPRYYSISSSSVVQPRQVALTAVVADKPLTGSNDSIPGLCTNYLLGYKGRRYSVRRSSVVSQRTGDDSDAPKIFAHIRKSTFKLPALSTQPVILVGAGTGIAPFRAFLQERARLAKMGRTIGRTILFFGCRNEAQDYIYRDELKDLQDTIGSQCSIITAFSRPNNGKKVYVQDQVAQHADEVCDLLVNGGANFYICGSAAMARDVSKVLSNELGVRQGWDGDQLRTYMERQRKSKRWQQDVWG